MSRRDIIRAWKDEGYRLSLSDSERSRLPANPAGIVELSDTELGDVAGGMATVGPICSMLTLGYCTPHCSSYSCHPGC